MNIDFDKIDYTVLPHFCDGLGDTKLKIFNDSQNKIMKGCLNPGCTIGMHTHDQSSEIVFILSGQGYVLYDDGKELLHEGSCHYCPKGHAHSLCNDSADDLIFYAIVPQQ